MRAPTQQISHRRRPGLASTTLSLERDWVEVFDDPALAGFTATLQDWLPSRRWFRGKARAIESVGIRERIAVPVKGREAFLALLDVTYADGGAELYVLPMACAFGRRAAAIARDWPRLALANVALERPRKNGVLYDAIVDKDFCRELLALTAQGHKLAGRRGDVEAEAAPLLRKIRRERGLNMEPVVGKAEQSNSSIIYKGTLILKFFRRLDAGINPELEIERFLAARRFPHSPPLAGALEYHDHSGRTFTMAVMTSFVPGCHDAWEDTLSALNCYYDRVRKLPARLGQAPPATGKWGAVSNAATLPRTPADLVGSYLQDAMTLGQRTAALHLALSGDASDPAFRPEPWMPGAQRSLFKSLNDLTRGNFELLRELEDSLASDARPLAEIALSQEPVVIQRFRRIIQQPINATRIRTHGDYHLGQVLHHGSDYLIIDFEGEPALAVEERRAKQSALRDVAGMIYSFFYAANAALREPQNRLPNSRRGAQAAWARYWAVWVSTTFLRAYLETARSALFIPRKETALKVMLDVELLRKAIYELGYELNNRPDWVKIALQVLLDLLNPENPI